MTDAASGVAEESGFDRDSGTQSAMLAAFEQANHAMLALGADGVVVAANAAAHDLLGVTDRALVGRALWDVIAEIADAQDAAWFQQAITRDAEPGRSEATRQHVLDHRQADRATRWTVRAGRVVQGRVTMWVVEARDVTEERHAQAEERLFKDLALALGQTDSLELGLGAVLQAICAATGWSLAEAWLPSAAGVDSIRLTRSAVWAVADRRLQHFVAQGAGFQFAPGEGLPGTAWQRREVVWDSPLGTNSQFTRASLAAQAGLRAALAIPIMAGGEPVAVVSCYMRDLRTLHKRLVAGAVASQLGPLVKQKEAEEAHRNAEAQLAGTIAVSTDAIISIDEGRRITLFNWGAERIFGYTADEALGESLDMLLPEDVRSRHATEIAHFARSAQTSRRMGERSAIVGRRKNGDIFPAEASISRYMVGGRWTFTVMLRDITDRRRTEDGLRLLSEVGALLGDLLQDQAVLQRVAERAVPMLGDTCVIDLVEAGQVQQAALAARDPLVARAIRAFRDANPPSWDQSSPMVDVMRSRETVLLPDGIDGWSGLSERPDYHQAYATLGVQSLLIVPLVAHDNVLGSVGFAMATGGRRHDGTYRALAEEFAVRIALAVDSAALYQRTRQAVGARDETMAVVSHDLRNPLSAIKMYMSALRGGPPASPEAIADLVGLVQESTGLMSRIIDDLMDVASIDAGRLSLERRRHPVRALLERVEDMFRGVADERGIALIVEREGVGQLPDVDVDGERITQVLANLLNNALKFTEAGGIVTLRSGAAEGRVTVAVSDTGAGIPPADLPHVFERFWHGHRRTKIRSTGLGLAIARGIVQAHGGRIWAESVLGQGSTFSFELPVADR